MSMRVCVCVCVYVCVSVCVCVCVPPCLLAHPNTSRLITERESEGVGVEDPIPPFINERTKDGVFPLSSSSPPPLPPPPPPPPPPPSSPLSSRDLRWQTSTAIFTLPWSLARHTHTHASSATIITLRGGKKKRERVRVNFACLHPPVRGDRWIHRLKREVLGVNFTSRLGRFLFYLWHLSLPQSVPPPPPPPPPPPSSSPSLPLPSSVTTLSSVSLLFFFFYTTRGLNHADIKSAIWSHSNTRSTRLESCGC